MCAAPLEKITIQEKIDWLNNEGSHSYVGLYCKMMPDFIETSCLVTAAVLRKRITPTQPFWTILDSPEGDNYAKLSVSFLKKYNTFEIAFGCNEDYDSHVLIVHNNVIYQSFFKRFDWDCKPSPFNTLQSLNDDDAIEMNEHLVDSLVGVGLLSNEHYDYILSVPHIIK